MSGTPAPRRSQLHLGSTPAKPPVSALSAPSHPQTHPAPAAHSPILGQLPQNRLPADFPHPRTHKTYPAPPLTALSWVNSRKTAYQRTFRALAPTKPTPSPRRSQLYLGSTPAKPPVSALFAPSHPQNHLAPAAHSSILGQLPRNCLSAHFPRPRTHQTHPAPAAHSPILGQLPRNRLSAHFPRPRTHQTTPPRRSQLYLGSTPAKPPVSALSAPSHPQNPPCPKAD